MVVVVDEVRGPLVGGAVEEAVVTVEPALQGPLVVRAGGGVSSIGARCHLPTANVA